MSDAIPANTKQNRKNLTLDVINNQRSSAGKCGYSCVIIDGMDSIDSTIDTHEIADVGAKIRAARESKMMNQSDLAEKLGVGIQSVSNWENEKQVPRKRRIIELAQVLGLWEEFGIEPPGASVEAHIEADLASRLGTVLDGIEDNPAPRGEYLDQLDRIEGQLAVIIGLLRRRG